jgi:hypothetical protein
MSLLLSCREEMVGELAGIPSTMVDQLQDVLGITFEPGHTPGLRFMSHLWEPLKAQHHPLLMYAATELLAVVQHVALVLLGFKYKRLG